MTHIHNDLIRQIPKTDLHCHFDGSIRINTVIEFAKKRKVPLYSEDPEILKRHMRYGYKSDSLEQYLEGFALLVSVLQDKEDLEQSFYEICEDAAHENVRHLELRYCPHLHTAKGLSNQEVVRACIKAAHRAEKDFNLSVKQILCGLKHRPREEVFAIAQCAVEFRDQGVVAFDLAGPEKGFPIKAHEEAIRYAHAHKLSITMHAGESCGPESIHEALVYGRAQRIGHGISLIDDEDLLKYVVDHRIGIECCPSSNVHTGTVAAIKDNPLKKFLERGVRVSINTDNRLVSDTSVSKEISLSIEHLRLSANQLKQLLKNGFKSAFLNQEKKASLLREFDEAWTRLELNE